jgi:hypothetical protein
MGMRLVEASYYLVKDGWHKLGVLKQGSFFGVPELLGGLAVGWKLECGSFLTDAAARMVPV